MLQQAGDVMDAVVKIYCTHTEPNYSLPWQRKRQYSSTSSGFVVLGGEGTGERYLLTNAHSVEYYSQVCVFWVGGWVVVVVRMLRGGWYTDLMQVCQFGVLGADFATLL